jgi:hypothetical protein
MLKGKGRLRLRALGMSCLPNEYGLKVEVVYCEEVQI